MTSIPVNNANALLNYVNQSEVTGTDMGMQKAAKESFSRIMGKITNEVVTPPDLPSAKGTDFPERNVAIRTDDATVQKADVRKDKETDSTVSDKMQDQTQKFEENSEVDDTAKEAVQKEAEQLVEEVAKEMDVTEEQVIEAMEILGLTMNQLFDPESLKTLLLELSGDGDEMSILTNETLYSQLQDLLQSVQNSLDTLSQDLGISLDEVKDMVSQMQLPVENAELLEEELPMGDVIQEAEMLPENEEPEGKAQYTISVTKDGETVTAKVTVDNANGDTNTQVTESPKAETHTQSDSGKEQQPSKDSSEHSDSIFTQPLQQSIATESVATDNVTQTLYQSAQTEEIMNQIVEYMKINVKADMQEMELQLHPASLGSVNVQLTNKDGAITAQFTTQNETVRAAIETQLIQLKEQFEEQGIKVDAVEVTVASHQDGGQFSQSGEEMHREQKGIKKVARRLNLSELDEEDDTLDESEKIAVEMMKHNGGTVDYTV